MVRSAWPLLAPDPQLSLRRACGQRDAALRVGSGGEVGGEGVAQRQPPGGLDTALRTTHGFESCVGAVGQEGLPGAVAVQVSGAGERRGCGYEGVGEILAPARGEPELSVLVVQMIEGDRTADMRGAHGGDLHLPVRTEGAEGYEVLPALRSPQKAPPPRDVRQGNSRDPAPLSLCSP
jgi:hypothetical protein